MSQSKSVYLKNQEQIDALIFTMCAEHNMRVKEWLRYANLPTQRYRSSKDRVAAIGWGA